jgi:hypothetical protein
MNMKRKVLAFGAVVGAAVVVAAAFAFPLSLNLRFLLVLAAALLSTTGLALYFPTVLEKVTLPPEAERIVDTLLVEIQDDIEDIKQRTLTPTHLMVLLTALLSAGFIGLVFHYAKLGAKWGPIPVLIPTAAAVYAAAFRMRKSTWFRDRHFRTPLWVFLIPLAGILISTWLGIYMTEPLEYGGSTAHERAAAAQPQGDDYGYTGTRARFYWLDLFPDGAWLDIGSCDGDACIILILAVVLIIVAVILIVGSAAIPHFWVLAGFTLLTCMGMIALRELRVRPDTDPAQDAVAPRRQLCG